MSASLETFLLVLGASAPVGGFIFWGLSGLLKSRKEIWDLQRNDEDHDEKFEDIEKRIERIEKWYHNDKSN